MKLNLLLLGMVFSLFLFGCSKNTPMMVKLPDLPAPDVDENANAQADVYLNFNPKIIEGKTPEPFDQTLSVKADGAWSITSSEDWLSASPSEGEGDTEVTLSVTASEQRGKRSATLKITSEGVTKSLLVNQPSAVGDIKDVETNSLVGGVKLAWKSAGKGPYDYVKVSYLKNGVEVIEEVDRETDSIEIEGLIRKEPTQFRIQAIKEVNGKVVESEMHETGAITPIARPGEPVEEIDPDELVRVSVSGDQLEGHTQEPSEGPVKDLVDGNPDTYWHSAWSSGVEPLPHWIQITFDGAQALGAFKYWNRNSANNAGRPTKFALETSEDGNEWTQVWTSEGDLPVEIQTEYTLKMDKNYTSKYFRLVILENFSITHPDQSGQPNSTFVYMAELDVYAYKIIVIEKSPEQKAEDEYYAFQG